MKELGYVLKQNKSILLLLIISCTAVSATLHNYHYFCYASIILIAWCVLSGIKLTSNVTDRVFWIFFMFLFFWLTNITGFNAKLFVFHVIPICFVFVLGHTLVKSNKGEFYIIGLLIVLALCTGLFNIFYSIHDTIDTGFINFDRIDYSFVMEQSTNAGYKTSSLVAAEMAPLLSCLILFFSRAKDREVKKLSIFGGALSVIAVLCILHFVSRAALLVVIVSLFIGILYRYRQGGRGLLWIVLVLAIVVVVFLESDLWKLVELKNESYDLGTGSGRVDRIQFWWDVVLAHPFGTPDYSKMSLPFAHNFWLDFAKIAGWVPAIMLVLFSLLNVRDVIRVVKNKSITPNVKLLVVTMTLAFLLAFSVEPIFEGAKMGMIMYFFFCGIVSALPHYSSNPLEVWKR